HINGGAGVLRPTDEFRHLVAGDAAGQADNQALSRKFRHRHGNPVWQVGQGVRVRLLYRHRRNSSSTSRTAPQVMAISAILKAGKYHSCQYSRMKSITCPWIRRSMTLPRAPPRISVSDQQNRRWPAWRRSMMTIRLTAATATPVKNQRCQPEPPARKLNA